MRDSSRQPPYFPADLPVFRHEGEILSAVRNSNVIILTGETGSGKTTGIAQILYQAGYSDIRITQPRITAATSVAEFVASALNETVGETVGYQSSLHKKVGPKTKIIFPTDGLQLMHEIHGHGIPDREDAVIVIDEHHERSENIDTLVGLLIERLKKGARFRLVFSSATADVDRLMAWLQPLFGLIPHIHVEGRTFPVHEENIRPEEALTQTLDALREGKNTLVILPGVRQIHEWCALIDDSGLDVEILPLYADLSKEERDRVFVTTYDRPKVVVATNIAQTSITIPDLDVVVDMGLERVPTIDDTGVPGLAMALTSRADCDQRKGRTGRTRHGESYLAGTARERRRPHPTPSIHASPLESLVLRLAKVNLTPEQLEWLDAPKAPQLNMARLRLEQLGALKKGKITKLGAEMLMHPLPPSYARMVCEAKRRDVLADMLAMVACASIGKTIYDSENHNLLDLINSHDSDFIAQKNLFVDTWRDLKIANPDDPDDWLEEQGIIPRRFHRAMDLYLALCDAEQLEPFTGFKPISKTRDMLASVLSGLWPYGIWQLEGRHAVDMVGNRRLLSREGCTPADGELVVGEPFNLSERQDFNLYLLQRVSLIDKKLINQVVPGGFKELPTPKVQPKLQQAASKPQRKGKPDRRKSKQRRQRRG